MVAGQRRKEIDRRYRDAANRLPERKDEIDEATDLAVNSINEEPWERWW
jgi:hypothetical protein